jgi:hypothetical protein
MLRHWGLWTICLLISAGCSASPQPTLVIEEHLLTGAPDVSTDRLVFHFASGDRDQVLARSASYRDFQQQISDHNSRVLASFGYSLGGYQQSSHSYSQIYHGAQLLAGDVVFMNAVSVNASGTDFFGLLDLPDNQYEFTRDGLVKRPWPPDRVPYLYVGDQLLSVEIGGASPQQSLISVYVGDKLAFRSSFHNVMTYGAFDGPWSYGGHWALVLLDGIEDAQNGLQMLNRVIQDGRDLNAVNNYEQSFQFAVLESQPFFFYQRGGRIGISFAGREGAAAYDEIPRYQCCTGSLLNPGTSMNMVWFFARRHTDWYYVEAYVPSAALHQ